jgi:hypothetical protein
LDCQEKKRLNFCINYLYQVAFKRVYIQLLIVSQARGNGDASMRRRPPTAASTTASRLLSSLLAGDFSRGPPQTRSCGSGSGECGGRNAGRVFGGTLSLPDLCQRQVRRNARPMRPGP